MIRERLSETTVRELEALTNDERQKLIKEMWRYEPPAPEERGAMLAWLDRIEKNAPLAKDVDVVAMIHEGRR